VPVGRGLGGAAHADIAVGAADILDVELLLSQMLRQSLCDQAAEHVGRPARRVGNDHAHGARWIALRRRDARGEWSGEGSAGKRQEAAAKQHRDAPFLQSSYVEPQSKNANVLVSMLSRGQALADVLGSSKAVWAVKRAILPASESNTLNTSASSRSICGK
jgi:hypothetical protein